MKDWSFGKKLSFAVLLFSLAVCVVANIVACSKAPATPFEVGAEVPPPAGCADLRKRGGTC